MIARGLEIDAITENLLGHLSGDAESPGGVFDVTDRVIDIALFLEIAQQLRDDPSSRLANQIADKEDPQMAALLGIFHRPCLTDDGDFDLTRIFHLGLDLAGDITRQNR